MIISAVYSTINIQHLRNKAFSLSLHIALFFFMNSFNCQFLVIYAPFRSYDSVVLILLYHL